MKKRLALITSVLVLSAAFSSGVRAEEKKAGGAAPAAPKPAAELAQLKYFVGDWTCTGKGFASEMGPEHPTKANVKIRTEMNGFFVSGRYEEMKSKENPMAVTAAFVWGWDSMAKKIAATGQDSFGGMFTQTSAGWEGDKIVFTGDGMWGTEKAGSRDTFTKKSDAELLHVGEMQMKGQWTKLDEETCTKAAKK